MRATERIHRDIEEYLRPHHLFYDRRKNFYKNEGKPIDKIVSISHLAQAVMAIVLQRPNDARARPSSLLKRDEDYETVFNRKYPIGLYLACPMVMKLVDSLLRSEAYHFDQKDQTNLRFYLAMYLVSLALQTSSPTPEEVASLTLTMISDETIVEALDSVCGAYAELGGSDQSAKGTELVEELKGQLRKRFPKAGPAKS